MKEWMHVKFGSSVILPGSVISSDRPVSQTELEYDGVDPIPLCVIAHDIRALRVKCTCVKPSIRPVCMHAELLFEWQAREGKFVPHDGARGASTADSSQVLYDPEIKLDAFPKGAMVRPLERLLTVRVRHDPRDAAKSPLHPDLNIVIQLLFRRRPDVDNAIETIGNEIYQSPNWSRGRDPKVSLLVRRRRNVLDVRVTVAFSGAIWRPLPERQVGDCKPVVSWVRGELLRGTGMTNQLSPLTEATVGEYLLLRADHGGEDVDFLELTCTPGGSCSVGRRLDPPLRLRDPAAFLWLSVPVSGSSAYAEIPGGRPRNLHELMGFLRAAAMARLESPFYFMEGFPSARSLTPSVVWRAPSVEGQYEVMAFVVNRAGMFELDLPGQYPEPEWNTDLSLVGRQFIHVVKDTRTQGGALVGFIAGRDAVLPTPDALGPGPSPQCRPLPLALELALTGPVVQLKPASGVNADQSFYWAEDDSDDMNPPMDPRQWRSRTNAPPLQWPGRGWRLARTKGARDKECAIRIGSITGSGGVPEVRGWEQGGRISRGVPIHPWELAVEVLRTTINPTPPPTFLGPQHLREFMRRLEYRALIALFPRVIVRRGKVVGLTELGDRDNDEFPFAIADPGWTPWGDVPGGTPLTLLDWVQRKTPDALTRGFPCPSGIDEEVRLSSRTYHRGVVKGMGHRVERADDRKGYDPIIEIGPLGGSSLEVKLQAAVRLGEEGDCLQTMLTNRHAPWVQCELKIVVHADEDVQWFDNQDVDGVLSRNYPSGMLYGLGRDGSMSVIRSPADSPDRNRAAMFIALGDPLQREGL